MVNIDNADLVLVLYIPLNGCTLGDELTLGAVSTHDAGERLAFTMQGWEVVGDFVKVCAERPAGMHPGEWDYLLASDGAEVSRGLMMVAGESETPVVKQYNKETEYKEYGN